jgi:hypothetical protein
MRTKTRETTTEVMFDTREFPEQRGGMLVCGINWGGDPATTSADPNRERYYRSFFSDASPEVMNQCRYRDRILCWLSLLGLSLKTTPEDAGPLERSISQVNWLSDQTPDTSDQNNLTRCIAENEFFFRHLDYVRPSFILFLSCDLLRALNASQCLPEAESILGRRCADPGFSHQEVTVNGHRHPRFKVGMQRFDRSVAIALPHPASRRGVADAYIMAFRDSVGRVLAMYGDRIRSGRPAGSEDALPM